MVASTRSYRKLFLGILASLALATVSSAAPHQADRLSEDSTQDLFIPQPTAIAKEAENVNLWASVITASSSTTEYFIACETAFAQPDECDGAFTGVTLVQGPKTASIELDGTTYACSYEDDGEDAVCEAKKGDAEATPTSLANLKTAVTIVTEATQVSGLDDNIVNVAKGKGGSSSSGKSSGKIKSKGSAGGGGEDAGARASTSVAAVVVALAALGFAI